MHSVAIFGTPRSGTSWLGQIFNSSPNVTYRYQPIFAYTFEDSLNEKSTPSDIRRFHQNLLGSDDEFICQKKNISGNKGPQFKKEATTHLVWKEVRYLNIIENLLQKSSIKIIGIVRHPCGVLKSWMKAPKEFESDWDIKDEWRFAYKKNSGKHDFYGYERWIDATRLFLKIDGKYANQFKLISYESLLKDPETVTKDLFKFIGLTFSDQTKAFLAESTQTSSNDPYDVYRENKKADEWQSQLPESIIDQIRKDKRFKELNRKINF